MAEFFKVKAIISVEEFMTLEIPQRFCWTKKDRVPTQFHTVLEPGIYH